MKSFLKISKLKLVGLIAVVPLLLAGTVFAYNIVTPPKITNGDTQTKQAVKTDKQATSNESEDTTPTDQTVSESTASTPAQTTTQAPKTATAQPPQSTTIAPPQQTVVNPTPIAPTCNETMKSSYTSLYNSQVTSENANWGNQVNAWGNYASGHGMSFSGYVQDQINQNKPAHDARLAQLQTTYYQNLASVNCNP